MVFKLALIYFQTYPWCDHHLSSDLENWICCLVYQASFQGSWTLMTRCQIETATSCFSDFQYLILNVTDSQHRQILDSQNETLKIYQIQDFGIGTQGSAISHYEILIQDFVPLIWDWRSEILETRNQSGHWLILTEIWTWTLTRVSGFRKHWTLGQKKLTCESLIYYYELNQNVWNLPESLICCGNRWRISENEIQQNRLIQEIHCLSVRRFQSETCKEQCRVFLQLILNFIPNV